MGRSGATTTFRPGPFPSTPIFVPSRLAKRSLAPLPTPLCGAQANPLPREACVPPALSLSSQLVADRQPPNALAGGREDRVAESRGEGRQPRLADAARRHIDPVRDDPDMSNRRRLVDAQELEAVEVVLLHASILEADLAVPR